MVWRRELTVAVDLEPVCIIASLGAEGEFPELFIRDVVADHLSPPETRSWSWAWLIAVALKSSTRSV